MSTPKHPDFEAYQRLQHLMQDRADRWVRVWDYGYRGGATNVRLSEAWGAGEHPYGEEILFYAPYVDGIGMEGRMSSRYLDDDSTLEADSKAWYEAYKAKQAEHFYKVRVLEETPEVQAYKKLTNNSWPLTYQGSVGYQSFKLSL